MRRKSTFTNNSDDKYFNYDRYESEGGTNFVEHEENSKK